MLKPISDTRLWLDRTGNGIPMLVFHGLGLDHTYLRPFLNGLAEDCTLAFYDQRGNGRSDPVTDWRTVSHSTWVEDAEALRSALGYPKVVVFGHSYGGFLAQEYAAAHGDKVAGLILCCTAPVLDYWPAAIANASKRGSQEIVQFLTDALSKPIGSNDELKGAWRRLLPLYFYRFDPSYVDILSNVRFSSGAFNHAFFECLRTFDMRETLPGVSLPTLILGGRYDWIMPPEQGPQRLHNLLTQSEMTIFEESGHFPFVEEQAAFTQVVASWLRQFSF